MALRGRQLVQARHRDAVRAPVARPEGRQLLQRGDEGGLVARRLQQPVGEESGSTDVRERLLVFLKVFTAFGVFLIKSVYGVWNPKTRRGVSPNNSTNTVARGLSNLRATAYSATLHGWLSATAAPREAARGPRPQRSTARAQVASP